MEVDPPITADSIAKTDRRKYVRQAARAVLPNATETKMFVTANVRAWRHFIEMRATPFADLEIRRLAIVILKLLQVEAPLLFQDFEITEHTDNTEIATPRYSKV
jgi:thymidylate synthase (FAD)